MNKQNTLESIWQKRMDLMKNKTWNGDDPKCGFDFTQGIHPHLKYENDSFKDLTIRDLRQLLSDIPEGIVPEGFKHLAGGYGVSMDSLYKDDGEFPVRVDVTRIDDQTYCVIYIIGIGAFSVSWYKSRGRYDSILNLEYGTPVTLEEMTDILVALDLESPYEIVEE